MFLDILNVVPKGSGESEGRQMGSRSDRSGAIGETEWGSRRETEWETKGTKQESKVAKGDRVSDERGVDGETKATAGSGVRPAIGRAYVWQRG